jgi:hypothetical protein
MNTRVLTVVSLVACLAAATPARATTVDLVAAPFTKALPGRAAPVPFWGFGAGADCATAAPQVPGPALTAAAGEPLVIRVTNCLAVPVSLVVPALPAALAPEASGGRVTSFTSTTAPGAVGTYTFTALRPGTFLYHSGTQPQVQVQMGLYGALRIEEAPGVAYPGVEYDDEAILVFSEVDGALHDAVANGTFGGTAYRSTVRYAAQWFLVNGEVAQNAPAIGPVATGSRVLLRLLNAGLEPHVAEAVGLYLRLVAEDGLPYGHAREEYSAALPPGKTVDALVVPDAPGSYAIYDRMLSLTNPLTGAGGMRTRLLVEGAAGGPTAVGDAYSVAEEGTLSVPAPGVLGNDSGAALTAQLVQPPGNGTLVAFGSDGSFTYQPAANFSGSDFFTYQAVSGGVASNTATVAIQVTPVNDPPTATDDAATVEGGLSVVIPVLANDVDPDGDALSIQSFTQGASGSVTQVGGSLSYAPAAGFAGQDAFTYVAQDPSGATSQATVTVTVTPHQNQPPVANDDFALTTLNVPITFSVVANDADPDGSIVPGTVTIVIQPTRRGTVVNHANGTVTFTPRRNFRGTDTFTYTVRDDEGAVSNQATVRVNVQ